MNRREWWRYWAAGVTGGVIAARTREAHAQGLFTTGAGTLHAVWVHGTSFQCEEETALEGTDRRGYGTLFRGKGGASTWFHVSIPAPVLINDVRPVMERVFVFYDAAPAVLVDAVHVWDGPRRIREIENLQLGGDRSTDVIPQQNAWGIRPVPIVYGLGLSVLVRFGKSFEPGSTQNDVLFTTAGADFRLPRRGGITDPNPLTPPPIRPK